ncbi:hypothetical protein V6N12_064821 [Hibiscus sabdariffa]|uniref:RNase H type-1 domain-containing protein n=1 Tax=Hibiscus sabdariffa TaxID=183260 RepID=A0ABR2G7N9_9ROSI
MEENIAREKEKSSQSIKKAKTRTAFSLVRAIAKLRQKNWVIDIIWIPRDDNRAADILVKLTDLPAFHIIELQSLSGCLLPFLHSDAYETSFV